MPILEDSRKIKNIKLPETNAEIKAYSTLLTYEAEKAYENKGNEMQMLKKILTFLIKDWDLTDKDGKKLEINEEIIGKLPLKDIHFLVDKLGLGKEFARKKK